MNRQTLFMVLDVLLDRAELRTDAGHLAKRCGVTRTQIAEALLHLDRKGLVDASRVKLTLSGLAAANALRADAAQSARNAA